MVSCNSHDECQNILYKEIAYKTLFHFRVRLLLNITIDAITIVIAVAVVVVAAVEALVAGVAATTARGDVGVLTLSLS